jgi:hypothetical protein
VVYFSGGEKEKIHVKIYLTNALQGKTASKPYAQRKSKRGTNQTNTMKAK